MYTHRSTSPSGGVDQTAQVDARARARGAAWAGAQLRMGKVCCDDGCTQQADTNPNTGKKWNRARCWYCHNVDKAAAKRELMRKRKRVRDSLGPASAPSEPDDLDALSTQEWAGTEEEDEEQGEGGAGGEGGEGGERREEGEEGEARGGEEREVGVLSPSSDILAQLAQLEAQASKLRTAHAQELLKKERAEAEAAVVATAAAEAEAKKAAAAAKKAAATALGRCPVCCKLPYVPTTGRVCRSKTVCRCDLFPMALPFGLAYGDIVLHSIGTTEATATVLYFVPAGPWSAGVPRPLWKSLPTLPVDSVLALPLGLENNPQNWILLRAYDVSPQTVIDLSGRRVRAPTRYEPERIAASRTVNVHRRRQCFNRTLGGEHRCFCCFCLLVFSYDDEYRINTAPGTANCDKVRAMEAGHIYAHSRGVALIGHDIDGLWNLMPLCHTCNARMGTQTAWDFIAVQSNVHHLHTPDYVAAQALYEQSCPAQLT